MYQQQNSNQIRLTFYICSQGFIMSCDQAYYYTAYFVHYNTSCYGDILSIESLDVFSNINCKCCFVLNPVLSVLKYVADYRQRGNFSHIQSKPVSGCKSPVLCYSAQLNKGEGYAANLKIDLKPRILFYSPVQKSYFFFLSNIYRFLENSSTCSLYDSLSVS